jgi:hypothetical protein
MRRATSSLLCPKNWSLKRDPFRTAVLFPLTEEETPFVDSLRIPFLTFWGFVPFESRRLDDSAMSVGVELSNFIVDES